MKNKQIKKLNKKNKEQGISKNTMILRYTHFYNVRPRSSDPFDIVTYYIKRVTTSWTNSISNAILYSYVFDVPIGKSCSDLL